MENNIYTSEFLNGFNEIINPSKYTINEKISIYNPTLEEIRLYGEDDYNYLLYLITRRPYDVAVKLYDAGIDYQSISEFDLFYDTATSIPIEYSCILFGKLDFTKYEKCINKENGMKILYDAENDSRIDEVIYLKILNYLRYVNFLPSKVEYDVGNSMAKKFLIDRMRRKQNKRLKDIASGKEKIISKIYLMVSYLVNHRDFKYDYDSVMKLHLCQLYESFYRITNKYNIDNMNYGVYSGTIDSKKLRSDDLDILRDLHV